MASWPKVKLSHIAAPRKWALNGGPFGSKLVSKDYVASGVPVIRGGNLPDGARFSFDDLVFVPEEKANDLLANNAHPGDIIFTQRGTLGQVGIIPPHSTYRRYVISQSQMKLTVDEAKAVREFIYYFFRCPATVEKIKSHSLVAGVPHINLDILRNWEIPLPSLGVQENIASILSAYDDLIDNNTRRIQILERMAQALYREWFVRFRFPGHAKVKLVDSQLGKIPQGWWVRRLDEVAGVNVSSARRGREPGHIQYVDISSVTTGRIEKIEPMAFADAPGRARRQVKHGDTVWSCVRPNRKSFALIIHPPDNLIVSTGFAVLTPTRVPFSFLHQAVTTDDFVGYLTNHATGAAYPAVTAKDFEAATLVTPEPTWLQRFHNHCEPLLLFRENLLRQNATLRRTRDLLLPRLLSGQVIL